MRNRVEITGVNTSELKTLSNERMMELIVKAKTGTMPPGTNLSWET